MALDLSMTREKTGLFFLSVYQEDGTTAQSLVGSTLYFHAAGFGVDIDKNSPASGIVINDIAGGADCATLTIDPGDTVLLSDGGTYRMPCELTMVDPSSNVFELNSGTLTISSNVGTP